MEPEPVEELEQMIQYMECCNNFIEKVKVYFNYPFITPNDKKYLITSIQILRYLVYECIKKIMKHISFEE